MPKPRKSRRTASQTGRAKRSTAHTAKKKARPVPEEPLTLEKLLSQITTKNRHPEVDWGPPVGKEIIEW